VKILLLNDNPVVNKLVTLSAQKTSDELDVVDSIDSIQAGEYDLLVVDDAMYNDNMFSEIKSKIMFGASLYICSRDAAEVKDFSWTLKKPFLPTDLVELFLKFSKEAEMGGLNKEEIATDIDELEDFDSQELKLEEETELDELDEFETEELGEELVLDEDMELSLDDELGDLDDELLLEDDELLLDDEELLLGDEDIEDGESVLDDEEAQKVKDLLDETSDDEVSQKRPEYEPQLVANELGLPIEEIEEFIQDFINQAYEFKDELYASLGNNDLDNIQALSHKIKGVAANLRMQEALDAISIVNSSSDTGEIEASLETFYKVVDKLAGINTSSSSEEETTDLDELEEFNTEELEVEESELENEFTFDEEEAESAIDKAVTEELALEEELTLDDEELELESEDELAFDEEEAESAIDKAVTEELALEEELTLDEEELELDEELESNDELTFDEEEAESAIDKAVTEELALESDVDVLDEAEDEIELDEELEVEEPEIENEFTFDEEEAESAIDKAVTEELALEEKLILDDEELDLETQIENAVEELSDEDLESELDEETLLEIATEELDSIDAFDSLTSNDLKLAIGEEIIEEVNIEEPELSSDDTDLDKEELNQEVATSKETEVQANSLEALENLLAALKDKNVAASMKGAKININITIGDE